MKIPKLYHSRVKKIVIKFRVSSIKSGYFDKTLILQMTVGMNFALTRIVTLLLPEWTGEVRN